MIKNAAFSRVRIPYGTWGTSYFPAWQSSPLAEVNIGQFAAESMARILGKRKVAKQHLEYLVAGSTIPWHWKFWNGPLLSACLGERRPGCHVEQACATGLQAIAVAAAEVQCNGFDTVGVLTFDRTSDSSVGIFPERRTNLRTAAISDVWDNFGFDPATGSSMILAAGQTARKYKLDRSEVDDISLCRYEQYFNAKDRGFLNRYALTFEVLNTQGKVVGVIDSDAGVRRVNRETLRAMNELDTCVTSGGQTHPSDGMAALLVASAEKAKELSARPEIDIRLVAKTDVRTSPSLMPEAPTLAVQKLLRESALTMQEIAVVKSHNPFAVNDAVFSQVTNYPWDKMNTTGCSLVWGHPQGPTMTRIVIEALEEAVELGGGYVLVMGCAAGDLGIAALFQVA
jgi:acetyl-CoA acetyltransferase